MKISKEKELEELQVLVDHIKEIYLGDYACVSRALEKAVYYLHYLEKDVLNPHEIQDVCYELHELGQCFHDAHGKQRAHHREHHTQVLQEIKRILS